MSQIINSNSVNITNDTSYVYAPKTIEEVVKGFYEKSEDGRIMGYDGKLNIRPPYQRDFVYSRDKQIAVIETVLRGAPLSNMYWVKTSEDHYELLDGQQRTTSICHFVENRWSVKINGHDYFFKNLPSDYKKAILNYSLQVYEVSGSQSSIIQWFKVINQNNLPLKPQEIRNSVYYDGNWLTAAKKYFSRKGHGAHNRYKHLIIGDAERQEILETALYWISGSEENITKYMAEHQFDEDAEEVINYFIEVCTWVENVIGNNKSPQMIRLGREWGDLYRDYHETFVINREEIDAKIKELKLDDEAYDKPKGFFPYIISGNPNKLYARQFEKTDKMRKHAEQNGICPICGNHFELEEMEADHIKPWKDGGKTTYSNLQMLCKDCNRRKGCSN